MMAGDFPMRQNDTRGFMLRHSSGWDFVDALDEHVALAVVNEVGCLHTVMLFLLIACSRLNAVQRN